MPKTWTQKLSGGKAPHVVTLEKAFAGVPVGARLFIASPLLLDCTISAIPRGMFQEVAALRQQLAKENGADATCPVSTAIFLRIVAEAALERVSQGAPVSAITPFWRVIAPRTTLSAKLSCGDDFISLQREMEVAVPA
ncbi:MAG: hypothetical protein ACOVN0_00390 [Niveispirillum sp.]|uniref:hypothetical protein n=1 Tax=Niveispirillum sp. TaxID=1917217 RepID=UPI003BA52E6B